MYSLNQAKEKLAKGESLSSSEQNALDTEDFFAHGGIAKEEVEMTKLYLELFWRAKEKDPNFDEKGKTTEELLDFMKGM